MDPSSSRNPMEGRQGGNPCGGNGRFPMELDGFLDFRREMDSQLNTVESNHELWEYISEEMGKRGVNCPPSVCFQKWGELLIKLYDMKKQGHFDVLVNPSYDAIVDYFVEKAKRDAHREPVIPETHPAFNIPGTGNEQPSVNLPRGLNHDQRLFSINDNNVVRVYEFPAGHWTGGAHFANSAGKVIAVRWGDRVKRIGIDGSPEAIKDVIKSAFGLRTPRQFWLQDDHGILRSIHRDMPLRNYTLHLVEGMTVHIYLGNAADNASVNAEQITFYTEDDFRDFLSRCGFIGLTDLSCSRNVHSVSELHHGEVYHGYRAPAN